jgi:hypothetical protein
LCLWCQWLWPLLYSALKRSKKEVRECNPSLLLWFFFCSSVNEWLRCENIHIYSHNFFTTKAMFHFSCMSEQSSSRTPFFSFLTNRGLHSHVYSDNFSLLTFLRGRLRQIFFNFILIRGLFGI